MSQKSVRVTHLMNMCVAAASTPPKNGETLVFQTHDGFAFLCGENELIFTLTNKLGGQDFDDSAPTTVIGVSGSWDEIKANLEKEGWTVTETNKPLTAEDVENILAEVEI